MVLITAKYVTAIDQTWWIVDIIHNICVYVIYIVRYITVSVAATTTATDNIWSLDFLADVARKIIVDILLMTIWCVARVRCTCRRCLGRIEKSIVVGKKDVVVTIVYINLRLRQRR